MEGMKINVLAGNVLANPTAQVLLLFTFIDDSNKNSLFNKVDQNVNKKLSKRAKQFSYKSEKGERFVVHDVDEKLGYDAIVVIGLGKKKDCTLASYRHELANAFRYVAGLKFDSVALYVDHLFQTDVANCGKALAEALHLSQYRFDKYKLNEEKKKQTTVSTMHVYVDTHVVNKSEIEAMKKGIDLGSVISRGVCLARDMVNEPGLHMTPIVLARAAQKIAKQSKGAISCKVFGKKECERLGMGAYLSIDMGSDLEPQFIILHHKPKQAKKSICLIGKSITFDSGGMSLKPSKSMETMKLDMAGGAAVLGVFDILSTHPELTNYEVYGILPACENMLSGKAIRPGDVVRALNGKHIEILNTDGEGRMTLADALSYAEKYLKPDYIIDIATLTGAIMVALGPDITGLYGRDAKFNSAVEKAANEEGEELWTMPLTMRYLKKMKSDIADLKNVSGMGYGGATTAALFLSEFVKNEKWVHLDIAGASFNEHASDGIIPKGGTGWGVMTFMRLLQSELK